MHYYTYLWVTIRELDFVSLPNLQKRISLSEFTFYLSQKKYSENSTTSCFSSGKIKFVVCFPVWRIWHGAPIFLTRIFFFVEIQWVWHLYASVNNESSTLKKIIFSMYVLSFLMEGASVICCQEEQGYVVLRTRKAFTVECDEPGTFCAARSVVRQNGGVTEVIWIIKFVSKNNTGFSESMLL